MKYEALAKTNRINLLFDFYEPLLTEKQKTFLSHYFHDDYTLGEIAENFGISRQAVYEHIKRAEISLDDYEAKLGLLIKHEQRQKLLSELETLLSGTDCNQRMKQIQEQAGILLHELERID